MIIPAREKSGATKPYSRAAHVCAVMNNMQPNIIMICEECVCVFSAIMCVRCSARVVEFFAVISSFFHPSSSSSLIGGARLLISCVARASPGNSSLL